MPHVIYVLGEWDDRENFRNRTRNTVNKYIINI